MSQEIAIFFKGGEGSEELFERGNILNHVHEFYRNYWHPKNIKRLVDKSELYLRPIHPIYSQRMEIKNVLCDIHSLLS